ncbi:MAG TPA: ectoine/hydroxyectoine ABC transporter permease subunit EhuD [Bradyrhizobium sp.]|nr:ectoine/hydroxyectoine ABC transporter permease subunit EhuD [Bradyrhizobium sp.]
MIFDWSFAREILPQLLWAARITILITVVSFLLSLVGGGVVLWLRSCRWWLVVRSVVAVSDLVRATPLLTQVLFLFFVAPTLGIRLAPITAGIVAIAIHYSCYMAEVYRGALAVIKKGQWDAAAALGLSRYVAFRKVILPQMLPLVVPTAGSYLIYMFKDTPILAAITVREMMQVASSIGADNFRYMEPITLVGVIFLVVSLVASFVVRRIEKYVALPAAR